jgi:hypothetical protein
MEIHTGTGPGRKPNLVFALMMIAAGGLLFLANLGLIPIKHVWDYWPLIFVAIGFGRLTGKRSPGRVLLGITLVVLGIFVTLISTGILPLHFRDDSWPLSILFLALGFGGLARVLDGERWRDDFCSFRTKASMPATAPILEDDDTLLSGHTVMGNIQRKVESQNFRGGRLTCVMGNIQIDLRRANMPLGTKNSYLETNSVLGSIKLRVPESWRVVWNGENIMGNFHDKTIPPNTGAEAPQLVLSGNCTMGSIEVES